jgi:hypothetical protein
MLRLRRTAETRGAPLEREDETRASLPDSRRPPFVRVRHEQGSPGPLPPAGRVHAAVNHTSSTLRMVALPLRWTTRAYFTAGRPKSIG